MAQKFHQGITLSELSLKLRVNKSKLHYYMSKGLLQPRLKIGGVYVFDPDEIMEKLKTIKRLQKQELSLEQIKNKMNKSR